MSPFNGDIRLILYIVQNINFEKQRGYALRGMVTDFGDIRRDLKELADFYDHALIYESGTLKSLTIQALKDEQFRLIEVPFRPTAENFAKFFYEKMTLKGYAVQEIAVYETPNNCAVYQM